jgi:hypothetical protein
MTQLLGIQYIWIDSLCIIQDDVKDWRHEGSKMADIYAGAYITLAATSAYSSNDGFYQHRSTDRAHSPSCSSDEGFYQHHSTDRNRSLYTIYTMFSHVAPGDTYDILVRNSRAFINTTFGLERLPLSTRAWALQERLLSPRVVHFANDMLYWECLNKSCGEFGKLLMNPEKQPTNSMLMSISGCRQKLEQARDWCSIVKAYTSRYLTFGKDMLPALQGVAKHVQGERKCAYYAGLWEDTLCYDLLWSVQDPTKRRSLEYRAPSWSWAATQERVWWPLLADHIEEYRAEALVVHAETIPAGDDPLGEIASGKLILRGLCLTGVLQWDSSPLPFFNIPAWENPHWRFLCHMDNMDETQEDRNVTAILMAISSPRNYCCYCLVLQPIDAKSRIFRRVGILEIIAYTWVGRYDLFEKTVQERYDKGESWEGCPEYQEVTII